MRAGPTAVAIAALTAPGEAWAQTVVSVATSAELATALSQHAAATHLELELSNATFDMAYLLVPGTQSLTLRGVPGGATVLVGPGTANHWFEVRPGGSLVFEDLVVDCNGGMGILADGAAEVRLTDVEVEGAASAGSDGPVISATNVVDLTLERAVLRDADGTPPTSGGLVYLEATTATFTDTTMIGGTATNGAQIGALDSTVTVTGGEYTSGLGPGVSRGGSLYGVGSEIHVAGARFADHTAALGGAILITASAPLPPSTIEGTTFFQNHVTAGGTGGAVMVTGAELVVTDSVFESNAATGSLGGALGVGVDGTLRATGNRFLRNAGGHGASVFASGAVSVELANNLHCGNSGTSSLVEVAGGPGTAANETWVGNAIIDGVAASLLRASGTFVLHDALVYENYLTAPLAEPFTDADGTGEITARWVGVHAGDDTSGVTDPIVLPDAGFVRFEAGDCAASDFRLAAGSPAIDAGDPTVSDPDGSRVDLGFTGGPGGLLDNDGDGLEDRDDCAPFDPDVPAAAEDCANGVDDDCDGALDDLDPECDGLPTDTGETVDTDPPALDPDDPLPPDPGCRCASAAGPGPFVGSVALLPWLLRRRSRRAV